MSVAMRPVPLRASAWRGNEYTITAVTITNYVPRWTPPRRCHINLSTDGGQTWPKRVAYGVPIITGVVSYTWSLPWTDETFVTENALLQITDLAGEVIALNAEPFTIAGVFWHHPVAGETLRHNTFVNLEFVQAGMGPAAELGYITPTTEFQPLVTLSNLVAGTNIVAWKVEGIPYPTAEMKLGVRSVTDSKTWGLTGIVGVD